MQLFLTSASVHGQRVVDLADHSLTPKCGGKALFESMNCHRLMQGQPKHNMQIGNTHAQFDSDGGKRFTALLHVNTTVLCFH